MLDARFVADNVDTVKKSLQYRASSEDIDKVVGLYIRRNEFIKEVEEHKALVNKLSLDIGELIKTKNLAKAEDVKNIVKKEKQAIKDSEEQLVDVQEKLYILMSSLPNIPHNSVPIGKDESQNKELRVVGKPTSFGFEPQAHWDIGESLGILDPSTAAKITGARFHVYRGNGARLERSLINLMLDTHTANGYTEILPPFMVNRESMHGTGQLPKFEDGSFSIHDTNYFLVPTAEVPVTNMHRDEIITDTLPIKYCAYTACFRKEGGSAGRDTRGLIRQHQFNKVELVKFSRPEDSYAELEALTKDAESILQMLKLPYRVITLCSGDLGFSSAKTYDIEVWMPSYNRYVEISSCSNFEDFQARRASIRYRDETGKPRLVHTLNGSGLAIGRTVAAIIENYQTKDGAIVVPDALQKYMGIDVITKY